MQAQNPQDKMKPGLTVMQGSILPGDYSHRIPVDDGDIWVSRLRRVCLELCRQVESCQDFTFESPSILHHGYSIHHRHGHAQVTTWRNHQQGKIYCMVFMSYRVSLLWFVFSCVKYQPNSHCRWSTWVSWSQSRCSAHTSFLQQWYRPIYQVDTPSPHRSLHPSNTHRDTQKVIRPMHCRE